MKSNTLQGVCFIQNCAGVQDKICKLRNNVTNVYSTEISNKSAQK